MITALGLTAVALDHELVQQVASIEPFGWIILGIGQVMPYLLVCAAFSFLYAFLTNVRVHLMPALAGGVFASAAWNGIGIIFADLVASSSKYSAIYSGFAAIVLFIIWVNIGWLIILVGAHISRYWQNPELLQRPPNGTHAEEGHCEALALEVMALIGQAYYFGQPNWSLEGLAAHTYGGSPEQLERLIQSLKEERLILATEDDPPTYVPARDIETISLQEITTAARGQAAVRLSKVQALMDQINNAISESLKGQTLKDMVLADKESPEPMAPNPGASS